MRTRPEAEDAVSELLFRRFRIAPSVYTDLTAAGPRPLELSNTLVTVYLATPLQRTRLELRRLRQSILQLRDCGLNPGAATVSLQPVAPQDWAESWKRHFKPLDIAGKLLVKPSWSARRPRVGQAVLVLDPGLSFGTGQHPTTAFCLEQIVRLRLPGAEQAFLDVGTGSGILALAAAVLGYSPVSAFDNDPDAVRSAKENARRNGLGRRVRIRCATIGESALGSVSSSRPRPDTAPRRYALVCANLISDLLLRVREDLISNLAPGGCLVLAGILREEFEAVRRAYEAVGLRLVSNRAAGEWRSGAFLLLHSPACSGRHGPGRP